MIYQDENFTMEKRLIKLNIKDTISKNLIETKGRKVFLTEYPEIAFCIAKVIGGYRGHHYKSGLSVDRIIWSSYNNAIIGMMAYIHSKKIWGNPLDVMLKHENETINT